MESAEVANNGASHPQIELTSGKRNAVLFAVLLGLFLSALDQNVVGTALPRIVTDLHGSSLYTWVVTSYLLSSTITVPIYGKLSDIYGRKPLLLIGVSIFLIGSILCGQSQNMTELILFRGLQGLGAGALFPISLAVIGDMFTARERGRYQGLFGAVFGLSFLLGPFIGGWITDNVSWHWVFYVNLPLGLITLVVISTVLPNFHPNTGIKVRDLDYLGIGLFTVGVVPMMLGLNNKGLTNSHGTLNNLTDLTVGGFIVFGVIVLIAFVLAELRAKQPIIPMELFRNRNYSATQLATFMVAFGMFASIVFLPRYYQAVRGISATKSGYMLWPLLVGLIGSSISTGILISKFGRYKVILLSSVALLCVGGFFMTHLTRDTSDPVLWAWMFVMGVGIGPSMSGFTVVVQNSAPLQQLGAATSTLTFLRQIGGSVGLAIAGTLFSQTFTQKLPVQLAANGVPKQVISRFTSGGSSSGQGNLTGVNLTAQLTHTLPASLHALVPRIVAGVDDAFSIAIANVFWLTFGAGVLALLAIVFIADQPLRQHTAMSAEAADAVPGAEVPVTEDPRGRVAAG
jgi:EmrB/QacA subfamily drug resistance transporter